MNTSNTLRENLHIGYLETGSIFVELSPELSTLDRAALQPSQLRHEIRPIFESAKFSRLYSSKQSFKEQIQQLHEVENLIIPHGKAFDVIFHDIQGLLGFLSDRRRMASHLREDKQILPAYDNLLCFFDSYETVPLEWWRTAPSLLYYVNPFKGMNRVAVSELRKHLSAHSDGCVVSISLGGFESAIAAFPGKDASEPFWKRLCEERIW